MHQAQRVERIAHRGAKRELAENTLPAFRRAMERGAHALELDVHATTDGVVVVHHDPDLAAGGPRGERAIARLDWPDLAAANPEIPRLSDVLEAVPERVSLYIELKGAGVEAPAADLIRGSTRCAVHSFDHAAVRRVRELAPDLPRGILFDTYPADVEASMRYAGARDVWPEWRLVDERLVAAVHDAGGRVLAWTVNDRDAAARLIRLGVDGICSDDVRLLDDL
jgi:glycerophosphoryl diester phosphodiesterase